MEKSKVKPFLFVETTTHTNVGTDRPVMWFICHFFQYDPCFKPFLKNDKGEIIPWETLISTLINQDIYYSSEKTKDIKFHFQSMFKSNP